MCSSEIKPRIYAPGKALESCCADSLNLQEKTCLLTFPCFLWIQLTP